MENKSRRVGNQQHCIGREKESYLKPVHGFKHLNLCTISMLRLQACRIAEAATPLLTALTRRPMTRRRSEGENSKDRWGRGGSARGRGKEAVPGHSCSCADSPFFQFYSSLSLSRARFFSYNFEPPDCRPVPHLLRYLTVQCYVSSIIMGI